MSQQGITNTDHLSLSAADSREKLQLPFLHCKYFFVFFFTYYLYGLSHFNTSRPQTLTDPLAAAKPETLSGLNAGSETDRRAAARSQSCHDTKILVSTPTYSGLTFDHFSTFHVLMYLPGLVTDVL